MQNADYLVVIELLGHPDGRALGPIQQALGVGPETLLSAVESLEEDGVIVRRGDLIWPSRAMRRLDRLNLIAV